MFGHDDQDENNQPHDEHQKDSQPADDIVKPSDDASSDDNWQHPGPPPSDSDDGDEDEEPSTSKTPTEDIAADYQSMGGDPVDNSLIDLKQEALTKLSPLVGHLDQAPDEKFRTLMMMIQASDDQKLVKQAYETALKIDDEKERAQALLDIVNEINYFTQSPGKPE